MKRLFRIEWLKLQSYKSVYVFTGMYAILVFFSFYGAAKLINLGPLFNVKSIFTFPSVWYFVSYLSSWFFPILSILMILFVCNEFSFRTFRQHVIDGLAREELLYSKILLAALLSVYAGCLALITGLSIGIARGGMPSATDLLIEISYLLRVVWACFGMCSAALLIALLVRRSALSILVFLSLFWIIEPLIGRIWFEDFYPYFPLNSLDEFTSSPIQMESVQFAKKSTPIGVTVAGIIYPFIFLLASWSVLKSKDL